MQQAPATPVPAELDIMPVEHLPEYVIGFPAYVAITVRAHPNINFNRLPFADFLNLRTCIGVDITPLGGGNKIQFMPTPVIDPDYGMRGGRLAAGQSRRMLTDVSPYFASVRPGEYSVQFYYVKPGGAYPAAPVWLRFRNPTAAETPMLASAAPDRAQYESWGRWSFACPPTPYTGPITADNPLRFNLLFRRLVCGAEPPERVDPAILDVLTGLYAPEGNALRAELYRARGDDAKYQEVRSQVLRAAPGLQWWMTMTDGAGAFIKSLRMM